MKKLLLLFALILNTAYSWADDWGSCVDGVSYVYSTSDQTLTISKTGNGTGEMTFYSDYSEIPWYPYSKKILKIVIEEGVRTISAQSFTGCSNLAFIEVNEGNTFFDSRDSCDAIIKTMDDTLILGCKSTVVPNGVAAIGDYAFSGCIGLTSIDIPNSVTSIGTSAFYGCSGLTSVTLYPVA